MNLKFGIKKFKMEISFILNYQFFIPLTLQLSDFLPLSALLPVWSALGVCRR